MARKTSPRRAANPAPTRRKQGGRKPAAGARKAAATARKQATVARKAAAQREASKKATKKAAASKRRRNSEAPTAADLYETFHGKASQQEIEAAIEQCAPTDLAALGKLVDLQVLTADQSVVTISAQGNTLLCCTPDGGQLYFTGGNQSLDLDELGLSKYLPKDHLCVGEVLTIAYRTEKDFHGFEPTTYEHSFDEDGDECPLLNYDVHARAIYLSGGSYRVERPGIVR